MFCRRLNSPFQVLVVGFFLSSILGCETKPLPQVPEGETPPNNPKSLQKEDEKSKTPPHEVKGEHRFYDDKTNPPKSSPRIKIYKDPKAVQTPLSLSMKLSASIDSHDFIAKQLCFDFEIPTPPSPHYQFTILKIYSKSSNTNQAFSRFIHHFTQAFNYINGIDLSYPFEISNAISSPISQSISLNPLPDSIGKIRDFQILLSKQISNLIQQLHLDSILNIEENDEDDFTLTLPAAVKKGGSDAKEPHEIAERVNEQIRTLQHENKLIPIELDTLVLSLE